MPALHNRGPNRSDRQFLSLSFACASSARLSRAPPARASCLVRVRISSRWPPQQRRLPRLSAFACGNLRCRGRPRDKIAHSGENCILVYNAKAVPPPVSGSSRSPIFVPTLSAADNQAFLSRTETNITKKKDLSRPLVNQNTSLEHLAAAAAVALVRTQGWAGGLNDNIQRGPPSRPSLSNPKEMQKGLLFVASLSQSQCSPKTSFLTARSIARLVNRETSVPAGPLASTPEVSCLSA